MLLGQQLLGSALTLVARLCPTQQPLVPREARRVSQPIKYE